MDFKFEKILIEQRILVEGRKEDARKKYPDINEDMFNIFVSKDPSGNQKYLMAICKMWYDRYGRGHYENYAEKLMSDVAYFHEKPNKYDEKDLSQYSLYGFQLATEEARLKLTKGELKKQANKLFETDKYLIVEPTSHASSCYYGSGTRWCTTMKTYPNYFNSYYGHSSLFYFINKKNGKKRAFLTPLGRTMFGGSFKEPDYETHRGDIYTEADNLGRSMRGIPIEGRMAMAQAHKRKSLEKDPSIATKLTFGEKILVRNVKGDLDLRGNISTTQPPNSIKKVSGDVKLGHGMTTANRIKEIGGDLSTSDTVTSLGSLERVGGDLGVGGTLSSLGNLQYIGGDLKKSSYWRNNSLISFGDLKHVGGTLYLNHFPKITIEELKKLDYVKEVVISDEIFNSLTKNVRLPNLPNTPIEVV